MIEFGQTPIDQAELYLKLERTQSNNGETDLSPFVIYHYIVWLHITVHYALGMTVIQGLECARGEGGGDGNERETSNR